MLRAHMQGKRIINYIQRDREKRKEKKRNGKKRKEKEKRKKGERDKTQSTWYMLQTGNRHPA